MQLENVIKLIYLLLGSTAQVMGYCLESPAPPFPVFVLGYTINGFGMGLQVRATCLRVSACLISHFYCV